MANPAHLNSDTLFPMPEATPVQLASWEDRIAFFNDLAKAKGGLIPLSAVKDIMQVSAQRVHQLAAADRLERVVYFGQTFVTGRSVRAWMQEDRAKGGRGHRRLGLWKSIVVGAKLGTALAYVSEEE